jgi:hypothetical protein
MYRHRVLLLQQWLMFFVSHYDSSSPVVLYFQTMGNMGIQFGEMGYYQQSIKHVDTHA